jgi:hypothetical protein
MQCFNHTDTPAVAICLSCGKALCKSCAMNTSEFIVCSDSCKNRLTMQRSLKEKEPKAYLATSKFMFFNGLIFMIAGCLMLIFQPFMRGPSIFFISFSVVNLVASYFLKKLYGSYKTGLQSN